MDDNIGTEVTIDITSCRMKRSTTKVRIALLCVPTIRSFVDLGSRDSLIDRKENYIHKNGEK